MWRPPEKKGARFHEHPAAHVCTGTAHELHREGGTPNPKGGLRRWFAEVMRIDRTGTSYSLHVGSFSPDCVCSVAPSMRDPLEKVSTASVSILLHTPAHELHRVFFCARW